MSSRIPPPSSGQPKKGILKRPISLSDEHHRSESMPSFIDSILSGSSVRNRFAPSESVASPRSLQKLSVGFSGRNEVAIFGDTSDEYNTETENDARTSIFSTRKGKTPAAVISPMRPHSEEPEDETTEEKAQKDKEGDEADTGAEDEHTEGGAEVSEDDVFSVGSSTGSSHIAGKWWFGKSTRYVLHCEKKGCRHKDHDHGENYLTPTQRKNKEIIELKKELKTSQEQLRDKEKQLVELRDRLKEIEALMGSGRSMTEEQRLLQKQKQLEEENKREAQELVEKHEIRVRQLIQETVDLRAELVRKSQQMERLKNEMQVEKVDVEQMTDPVTIESQNLLTVGGSNVGLSATAPASPAGSVNDQQRLTKETLTQLELEIVVKEQMMKMSTMEAVVAQDLDQQRSETEVLRATVRRLSASSQSPGVVSAAVSPIADAMLLGPRQRSSQDLHAVECQLPSCVERKRGLIDENKNLLERMEEETLRIRELEDDVNELRTTVDKNETEFATLQKQHEELKDLATERLTEAKASQMALERMQEEKETLKKAISYLEERCQLVVKDEATNSWQRGYVDPRYMVMHTKNVQTELTSEALTKNESQFLSLHDKLKQVEAEFYSKQSDMHERFAEIEENLMLKTSLVESLTRQLELAARESQHVEELRQKERDVYQNRINELARQIDRIPIMEMEVERTQQEKSKLQLRFNEIRDEYNEALEDALAEAMRKYNEQSKYWKEKVANLEIARGNVKNHLDKLYRDFEDLKMRNQMEKAELEQRLTSSIDHVSHLNNQINFPRKDAQCDAKPKTVNKYVACKPNHRHRPTSMGPADVTTENGGASHMQDASTSYQDELTLARAQIHGLQRRLFDAMHTKNRKRSDVSFEQVVYDREEGVRFPSLVRESSREGDESLASCMSSPTVMQDTRDTSASTGTPMREVHPHRTATGAILERKIVELERRNADLALRLRRMEETGDVNERIAKLTKDFEAAQKESEVAIREYENVNQQLSERVASQEEELNKARVVSAEIRQLQATLATVLHRPQLSSTDEIDASEAVRCAREIIQKHTIAPTMRTSSSHPNLREIWALPVIVPSYVQEAPKRHAKDSPQKATLQKTFSPQIKPFPLPSKWDLERNGLLRQISKLKSEVVRLNKKLGQYEAGSPMHADFPEGQSSTAALDDILSSDIDETMEFLGDQLTDINRVKEERTRQDNEYALREQLTEVQGRLDDALRELEVYHTEMRQDALSHQMNPKLARSRSDAGLATASCNPAELARWKETAGVTFREVHRLRKGLNKSEAERLELRNQLFILRGELEFANCLVKHAQEKKSPKMNRKRNQSLRSRASLSRRKSQPFIVVSEDPHSGARLPSKHSGLSSSVPDVGCSGDFSVPNDPMTSSFHEGDLAAADDMTAPKERERPIIQEALRSQVAALRDRNHELENHIADLNSKAEQKAVVENELSGRVHILQSEVDMYEKKVREMDEERQQMYLVMFRKGQQAARQDIHDEREIDQLTEDRITLKFLHDTFYYYLLNKGNAREHLQAIMTMLNFTSKQKDEVAGRRGKSH
ncbi:Protein T23F2.2 b [Aphelenchoides avenae]|nr:Protein T23F2.2 b [Aphelenchus avenae]